MSASSARRVVVSALTIAALALFTATATAAPAQGQPWDNPNQPPLTRANELLAALSTDQQIQLALGNFADLSSFGVPAVNFQDGPDGIRNPGTTALPSGQAVAATFDRALAYAYGSVVGSEARGEGFSEWTGPAVDIDRTPLAGRQPEAEGEDPFLAGNTAAGIVAGAKSQHVIVTLKHYTAYNQDYGRIGFDAIGAPATNVMVSERALQELYEEPFRIVDQQAGLDSVMCSYNQINGLPSCQNPTTLGDLKNAGFNGFVVPDFGFAVRDPLAAANAGVDLPALPTNGMTSSGLTAADFTSGQISAARLADMDRRILFAIFDSGLFDNPLPATPSTEVSTPHHQQVATQVAEAGTVLLKNDDSVLPLTNRDRRIALIGPTGNDAVFVTGGSASVPIAPGEAITPLAGITSRAAQTGASVNAVQGSAGDAASTELVPSSVLTPSGGTGPGLLGQYWNNGTFTGAPAVTQVDPAVNVGGSAPGSTPPPAAVSGGTWSAKWTGTLTPTETGLYRFTVSEAGLATLKIAGQTFGPAYREATQFIGGPNYVLQGTVNLTAGKAVPVEVDYSSRYGLFSHEVHLAWQQPSESGITAAVAAARNADVAVVFANDAQGEGMDRTSLDLQGDQDQLIEAVARANRHTVVVLNTGGPVLMPWLNRVEGVLETWYPGQTFGTSIAAVLFGDANPGGRLPVTFPASDAQGPGAASPPNTYPGDANGNVSYPEGLDVGYRWYDATGQRPLFPFGYGLSYERFDVAGARAFYDRSSGNAYVVARVRNSSKRPGPATVELFLQEPATAQEPPKQLKGFAHVDLGPGQRRFVLFRLTPSDLGYYNSGQAGFTVAPGRYTVLLGTSSTELDSRASFEVGRTRGR
ncbi:MAG TPA: glycoside hydrolase family 3 C-terminal domain-containing protein [Solirubrobacteraceae bacterium]|jgi:beta-glucosidase|nr:glycoside hydrolase family 3 C-terminal domain-containing protein [Solirubrobacteraceae bacterium]